MPLACSKHSKRPRMDVVVTVDVGLDVAVVVAVEDSVVVSDVV